MSNRKFAIKVLEETGKVIISCNGHSMEPLIYPKENISLLKVDHSLLRVNDACLVKIKGALQCHLISAIDEPNNRFQISNNKKFINGWVSPQAIYGLAVQVADRILVSEKELTRRAEENKKNEKEKTLGRPA
jgi:hypothetical protein